MKVPKALHSWNISPRDAIDIQKDLAPRVVRRGSIRNLRVALGADLAFTSDKQRCIAGVVVWDVLSQTVLEEHVILRPVRFPYVPGLLSFREAPAILAALRKVKTEPDVLLFDGQGIAHPRRFGLAAHVGLLLNRPSVGCAKSRLTGEGVEPGLERGAVETLYDGEECIGMTLRTRTKVKPLYISIGHRVSLQTAVDVTLVCATRYRLPEPTRLADQLVARAKTELAS
ncbi:MAG: deoxyribonuclease V [Phycisphaerae bacterium]